MLLNEHKKGSPQSNNSLEKNKTSLLSNITSTRIQVTFGLYEVTRQSNVATQTKHLVPKLKIPEWGE